MALKIFSAVAFALIIATTAFWLTRGSVSQPNAPYIFINETSDHRFDESIRVSILAAQKRSGTQNAVLISNRLPSDLRTFAAQEFQRLSIGKAFGGRGLLYVYSPETRELKIEVGYALEGALPDLRVADYELAAKTFVFSDRFQDFWAELLITLNREIALGKTEDTSEFKFLSGGAGTFSSSYDLSDAQLQRESLRRSQANGSARHQSVEAALSAYLKSLLSADPTDAEAALTAESLLTREFTPLTTAHLRRNWRMYTEVQLDEIKVLNQHAFAFFKPGTPVLPIVFKKQNGGWRVSEPLSWSLFQRFEDSDRVFLKYPLGDSFNARFGAPLYPLSKPLALKELLLHPRLNSYFEFYALEKTEKELSENQDNLQELEAWALADCAMNLGHFSKFLGAYEQASQRASSNPSIQANLAFYRKTLRFDPSEWRLER